MKSFLTAASILFAGTAAAAEPTNFGLRVVPDNGSGPAASVASVEVVQVVPNVSLDVAVSIASRLGRVTSTRRSVARNRAVGGVRNSYHLRGRAIDVVPYPGVSHAQLESALRRAGFSLIESLNEGDHSHFAFGSAPMAIAHKAPDAGTAKEVTQWRVVSAPRSPSLKN